MHPALAGVALGSLCRGGLVDHALLHDRAVHGEAVGGGLGGVAGGSCGDEGLEDGVLCRLRIGYVDSGALGGLSYWRVWRLTMMEEFHSPTLVCSYSVAVFRVASQACVGSVSVFLVEGYGGRVGLPGLSL